MIAGKHVTKVIWALMALLVCLCLLAAMFSGALVSAAGGTGVAMEYETALFDAGTPITVNILMADDRWDDMLQTAMQEVYYQCDVEVNGKKFYQVGIRPKGNTSLSSIVNDPDTDRYSFKLEFDQYVKGQTCFGLDKLILNNNYADATNMKEALIYDMFRYLGADASLYNYAKVSVNGKYRGVYLALEAVEDSFLLRNYGAKSGELYKPESMGMGGGGKGFQGDRFDDRDMLEMLEQFKAEREADRTESEQTAPIAPGGNGFSPPGVGEGGFDPGRFGGDLPQPPGGGEMPGGAAPGPGGGFGGGFSMGGGGANLNYSDDDLDSYSTIWEGEVTKTSKKDHQRVVSALKNISEGVDLESSMDIENLLRYAAVHMFAVNEDSLSGMMAHNYYLYEYKGKLNLLPWDYNLSLGGMSGSDGTSVVNDPIDDIFTGTRFFDQLMAREEYLSRYHAYLSRLVQGYIDGGAFDEFYSRTRSQIDSLVETDPTAFFGYEDYREAAQLLYETVKLRGQSIAGQLDGSIPSTSSGQRQDASSLIDGSSIDLSKMGSMMGGGPGGGRGKGGFGGPNKGGKAAFQQVEPEASGTALNTGALTVSNMSTLPLAKGSGQPPQGGPGGAIPGGAMPGNMPGGDPPGDFDPSQFGGELPEGFDPEKFGGELPEGFDAGDLPEGFDPSRFGGVPFGNDETDRESGEKEDASQPEPSSEDTKDPGDPAADDASESAADQQPGDKTDRPSRGGMGGPDFGGFGTAGSGGSGSSALRRNLVTYGVCFGILLLALLFASLFKRRSTRR